MINRTTWDNSGELDLRQFQIIDWFLVFFT